MRNRRTGAGGTGGGGDEDASRFTFFGPKIVVDAILGWRWPLSRAQAQAARVESEAADAAQLAALHRLQVRLWQHLIWKMELNLNLDSECRFVGFRWSSSAAGVESADAAPPASVRCL